MRGWTSGVLICCFIVALILLRHDELCNYSLDLEDISRYSSFVERKELEFEVAATGGNTRAPAASRKRRS
jgi:hypothetical protein